MYKSFKSTSETYLSLEVKLTYIVGVKGLSKMLIQRVGDRF